MAGGLTDKEVALVLGIKTTTVKSHLAGVRGALGARNTTHAVMLAIRHGLIDIMPGLTKSVKLNAEAERCLEFLLDYVVRSHSSGS